MNRLAKPTLGFDRKLDAIAHLHGRGLGVDDIVRLTNSTDRSVRTTLCQLRLKPHRPSTYRSGGDPLLFIELGADLLPMLRPHAARRGLTCAALAALIIDTVVADGLIDATLDDREDDHVQ